MVLDGVGEVVYGDLRTECVEPIVEFVVIGRRALGTSKELFESEGGDRRLVGQRLERAPAGLLDELALVRVYARRLEAAVELAEELDADGGVFHGDTIVLQMCKRIHETSAGTGIPNTSAMIRFQAPVPPPNSGSS